MSVLRMNGWLPAGLPAPSPRTVEGLAAAVIAVLIKSAGVRSTAELGMILFKICLGILVALGILELRAWRKWSVR